MRDEAVKETAQECEKKREMETELGMLRQQGKSLRENATGLILAGTKIIFPVPTYRGLLARPWQLQPANPTTPHLTCKRRKPALLVLDFAISRSK